MNRAKTLTIGGLLAAAFCAVACRPMDRHVEGKIIGMELEHSPDGGECRMLQVQLASLDTSKKQHEKVTLDTRKLDISCPYLSQSATAEIRTNWAEIIWDEANSHHGLRAVKMEITR